MAIKAYRNKSTRDVALGELTRDSKRLLPVELHGVARRKLAFLASVVSLGDLASRAGLGLHSLKGDRKGQHAIKINDQYRICFVWDGKNADSVEIVDYH